MPMYDPYNAQRSVYADAATEVEVTISSTIEVLGGTLQNSLVKARALADRLLGSRPEAVANGAMTKEQPHTLQTLQMLLDTAQELDSVLGRIEQRL